MTGLSGIPNAPESFNYKSHHIWAPQLSGLLGDELLSPDYISPDEDSQPSRRRRKRTKKPKRKHSRSSKTRRRHRLQGYILQVIGLLCFVLAAVKSFEPLTGVGFTLVIIGYNKNARKDYSIGKQCHTLYILQTKLTMPIDLSPVKERHKGSSRKKSKRLTKNVPPMEEIDINNASSDKEDN